MEVLIPADVESAALAELSAKLGVHGWPGLTAANGRVGTKLPTGLTKPESFVRLYTVGGGSRDLVSDSPTLVVEGWHSKEQGARDLCAMSVALIESAGRAGSLGGVTCYGVAVASLPANLPYPSMPDRFRFTATLSVSLRRSSL